MVRMFGSRCNLLSVICLSSIRLRPSGVNQAALPKNKLRSKRGTPKRMTVAKSPLPRHPAGTGRPREKMDFLNSKTSPGHSPRCRLPCAAPRLTLFDSPGGISPVCATIPKSVCCAALAARLACAWLYDCGLCLFGLV
jgi:hypothetical protein